MQDNAKIQKIKMRTSYKKNRPFDFKLIDHVEPNTLLYKRQTGLSNYDVMKAKTEIWAKIAEIMDCDVDFCLMRWNNLHYQYRKESRRAGGSTWPYFERLRFLADTQCRSKAKSGTQAQQQLQLSSETLVDDPDAWQSYNDCVVMHIGDMEQQADSTLVIEEIIESHEQVLQEEIIYEEDTQLEQVEQVQQVATAASAAGETHVVELIASPANDYLKMDRILRQLSGNHRKLAERRILAFVLKCQLRALVDEPIDDLVI